MGRIEGRAQGVIVVREEGIQGGTEEWRDGRLEEGRRE
jgi:hypothetical protein